MKRIVLAGMALLIAVTALSSCSKRQYICTCTTDLKTTEHYSGIYRSKNDAKNWCKDYENTTTGTTCAITN